MRRYEASNESRWRRKSTQTSEDSTNKRSEETLVIYPWGPKYRSKMKKEQ